MNKFPESATVSHSQTLRCCVGKFVYQLGSKVPLHFMPLKSFQIEDALDFSHLFYLRALRLQPPEHAQVDEVLQKWMDGTAVKPIADLVHELLKTVHVRSVIEFYPGIGLTFEYLKLLRGQGGSFGGNPPPYAAVGPPMLKHRIVALHQDDGFQSYESDSLLLKSGLQLDTALAIYNHNQQIKLDSEPAVDLIDFLKLSAGGPAVIALRVTTSETQESRTTVKGRHLVLPSRNLALQDCKASGGVWYWRFIPRFDEDYFIPDNGARTGLLLACRSGGCPVALDGFKPVE